MGKRKIFYFGNRCCEKNPSKTKRGTSKKLEKLQIGGRPVLFARRKTKILS